MNPKIARILLILLVLLGMAGMGICAYQMVVSVVIKEYIRLAIFAVLGFISVQITGNSLARLIKQRRKRR